MTHLTTVAGSLPVGVVGVADAHGHLWIDAPVAGAPTLTDGQAAATELALFGAAGGTLVVDCQPGGCGRDGRVLARLSAQSGVAVVAATGFHLRRYYTMAPGPWTLGGEDAARAFARELTEGLAEAPGIRAGVVKAAWTGEGGRGEDLMRAALTAARVTDRGLIVHTEAGARVEALPRLVEEVGVSPGRVQLSHVDKRPDAGLHRELARAGYMLGYDTFLRPTYEPERGVWPLLRAMIDDGLWRQITLGLDIVDANLWAARGGPGLRAIPLAIMARLRRDGVGEEAVRALGGGNVARLLAAPPEEVW